MKIGITGGTGGLGKRLTEYLISKGYQVRVLVRKTSQVDDLIQWGVELVYGDINDPASLVPFIRDVDICYHLAAQVSSATKKQLFQVNVKGTQNVCETVLKHNPNCRLVYCSSIVVKGVRNFNNIFLSNYTISKYKAEQIVDKYAQENRLKVSTVYPGYIYGPYDKNFMPIVIKMLRYGLKFTIKGGERNAPVVYVDDLCELLHMAGIKDIAMGKKYVSLKPNDIGIHGFIKIVADKMNYPFPNKIYPKLPMILIAFILDKVYKVMGLKSTPKINMRVIGALSNNAKYFTDNAIRELGWEQKVTIQEGIDKALTWQMNNG